MPRQQSPTAKELVRMIGELRRPVSASQWEPVSSPEPLKRKRAA